MEFDEGAIVMRRSYVVSSQYCPFYVDFALDVEMQRQSFYVFMFIFHSISWGNPIIATLICSLQNLGFNSSAHFSYPDFPNIRERKKKKIPRSYEKKVKRNQRWSSI